MSVTHIEYAINQDGTRGRNWNFYPGCNGPDGKPCSYCWSRNRVLPRMKCPECRTLKPHFHEERIVEPLHVKKPTRWLVCYTGDLFGSWVPDDIKVWAFAIMGACPQHTFLTLTKQPQNLACWSPYPDNCWVGVTATDVHTFIKALWHLNKVEAKVKYLSLEPLLDWAAVLPPAVSYIEKNLHDVGISWLIIGQQTPIRPETVPKVEWIQEIVEAADQAGVKVWLKNNLKSLFSAKFGAHLPPDQLKVIPFYPQWASDDNGELRQEMPCS